MSRLSNLIFRKSPLPILIVDRGSLKINEANPAAERIFREEASGLQGSLLKTVCAPGNFSALRDALKGPQPQVLGVKLLRAGKKPFRAEIKSCLLDDDGEEVWVLFIRDLGTGLDPL